MYPHTHPSEQFVLSRSGGRRSSLPDADSSPGTTPDATSTCWLIACVTRYVAPTAPFSGVLHAGGRFGPALRTASAPFERSLQLSELRAHALRALHMEDPHTGHLWVQAAPQNKLNTNRPYSGAGWRGWEKSENAQVGLEPKWRTVHSPRTACIVGLATDLPSH